MLWSLGHFIVLEMRHVFLFGDWIYLYWRFF